MKTDKVLEFKFMEDIMYYDGPLLSLGLLKDDTPVLEIWCSVNDEENYNIYAYAYIRKEDLSPFINDEKYYLDVLKDSEEIIVFYEDLKSFGFHVMNNDDFISQYGPTDSSSLGEYLVDFKERFEKFKNQEIENKKNIPIETPITKKVIL